MEETQSHHLIMLPSPGMGHLIPFVQFAKQLVLHHHLKITIIILTVGTLSKTQKSVVESLSQSINYEFLPPVQFDNQSEEINLLIKIFLSFTRSLPSVRQMLDDLRKRSRVVGFVVDLFGMDTVNLAKEFHIPSYLYVSVSALATSLLSYMPTMDQEIVGEYRDMIEPVRLPACIPIPPKDLPEFFQDRETDVYKWFIHFSKQSHLTDGYLVNTFMEMEAETIKYLQEDKEMCKPPLYLIGPLIKKGSYKEENGSDPDCLKWLDEKPENSVLFVSFGSGGTLSSEQIHELALGLEKSGQRFIWVVRNPDNKSVSGTYLGDKSETEPRDFLPDGFLERTKGVGLVLPSWAPQVEILSHRSTGGFLTHCGWNSVLESIVNGVPMIAWPLFGEQHMNALQVTEQFKVALRLRANENGIMEREVICKSIVDLLEGEEGVKIRKRSNQLKDAAANALSENGSSSKSLSELVYKWKNGII